MITCGLSTPQLVTITGSGFPASPIVFVTKPDCAPVQVPTLLSSSSTVITFDFVFDVCGIYEFVITDANGCASPPFPVLLEAVVVPPALPCVTLNDALDALADRLDDPNHIHWTVAELTRYINEALRTWAAYTQYYRNRESFVSVAGQAFYDLPTVLPTLRSYNVTDVDVITDMEYALMEPPTPAAWTGTEQFTLTDVIRALQQARDQFLRETGAVLTRSVTPGVTPAPDGRISVSADILQIRRAAWETVIPSSNVVPLKREDEWAMTNFGGASVPSSGVRTSALNTPAIAPNKRYPTGYSVAVTPPTVVQLAPAPDAAGSLDLLTINLGALLDPTVGVLLGIPDDWTWVIKWKALGDLLRQDGFANDPIRAEYCISRWKHGVALASQASVVLAAQIDNVPVRLFSVSDADTYQRTWQTTPKEPTAVLTDGHNVVALCPIPDANPIPPPMGPPQDYLVTLDVISNVPIATNGEECLPITESILEPILDYAEHLALFKEGPGQLEIAMSLYNSFERETGVTIKMDAANVPFRGPILRQTSQDPSVLPRTEPAEPTGSDENAP